jgi:hypothetical protein
MREEERPWVLRWYSQEEFRELLLQADFVNAVAIRENHEPVQETDSAFVFLAWRPF